jgi:hypothetical protein
MSCIGRELVTKHSNNCLQLEASGGDMFAGEITNVKHLDIFFQGIPCFLIADKHALNDEA